MTQFILRSFLYVVHFRALISLFHKNPTNAHLYYSPQFIGTVSLQNVSALKGHLQRE